MDIKSLFLGCLLLIISQFSFTVAQSNSLVGTLVHSLLDSLLEPLVNYNSNFTNYPVSKLVSLINGVAEDTESILQDPLTKELCDLSTVSFYIFDYSHKMLSIFFFFNFRMNL